MKNSNVYNASCDIIKQEQKQNASALLTWLLTSKKEEKKENDFVFCKELENKALIENNGNLKSLYGFTLYDSSQDKEISRTSDFLSIHKKEVELDCLDYQKQLFYMFYTQAYNCYDYLVKEYEGNKNKLDILEKRLSTTIDRYTELYSKWKMDSVLLFSKNQIDIVIGDRYNKRMSRQEVNEERIKYAVDKSKTALDRLDIEFKIKFIINKIWLERYTFLINYYEEKNKWEVKSNKEKKLKQNTIEILKWYANVIS